MASSVSRSSDPASVLARRWVALLGRHGVWGVAAGTAALLAVALFIVDLRPRVETDFFFSTDDPQMRASKEIERLFPSRPQILIAAGAADVHAPAYLERIRELTETLAGIEGVAEVRSLTHGPARPADAFSNPFWRRLLVSPDGASTNLLVELMPDGAIAQGKVVSRVEAVMAARASPGLSLAASGVPWVVEHIRRRLSRDLRVFTVTALAVFGVLILVLYRDFWIALGALCSCLSACAATLLLLRAADVPIGVLTANLATLVFVLTLSHCIYLTASHRDRMREHRGRAEAVSAALTLTAEPSFWCMVTTLLGFVSLRFASAKPLQELGTAGTVGTLVAFVFAYLLYPAFLLRRRDGQEGETAGPGGGSPRALASKRVTGWATAALAAIVLLSGLGLPRLDTDPSLPAYFQQGGEIRQGIERIDRTGGASTLTLLFRDAGGARLDTEPAIRRLARVQTAVESDPAVGTALTLAALVEGARRNPMAGFLPLPNLIDLLSSPTFDQVARSFVTAERDRGLALLRMRETGIDPRPHPERRQVVARLSRVFAAEGYEVERTGGLYPLQGALSELVRSSLWTGLGGLGVLFVGIAWAVSRSLRVTVAMLVCLAGTPVFLYGSLGWLGMPLDLICSPAANVAIAMGIDSMIHQVTALRRRLGATAAGPGHTGRARAAAAHASWADWAAARHEMWQPITGSALLLATGFGIFGLSSFPPTRRFGLAVLLGIGMAAALTLTVLPWLSARRR